MNRAAARLCAVVLILLSPEVDSASDLGPVFRNIGVADGLPDSRIETMVQDRHGYVWIGTQGGLVRYEGGRINVIGADPDQPDPLPARNIMSLLAHSDGTVWVGVEDRGVVQIGPGLEQRTHLDHADEGGRLAGDNIWSMAEDCRGRIWMAYMREGVAVFDPDTDRLTHFPRTEEFGLAAEGFQFHLSVDSLCRVSLVQTRRISVFQPETEQFQTVYDPPEGAIPMFVQEAGGEILFSMQGSIYTLGSLEDATNREPKVLLEDIGTVTALAPDPHSGDILLASTGGLYRWRRDRSGDLQRVRAIPGLPDSLPTNQLYGLLFDHEGGLWLRTARSGIAYMAPGTTAFERYQPLPASADSPLELDTVSALAPGYQGSTLWVGGVPGQLQHLRVDGSGPGHDSDLSALRRSLHTSSVVAIREREFDLVVASHARILRLKRGDDSEPEILMERRQVDDGTYLDVRWLDDTRLWVRTADRGIFLLDTQSGEREHFHPDGQGRYHLPEERPAALIKGPDASWWVAGGDTVYRWGEADGFKAVVGIAEAGLADASWQRSTLWTATDDRVQQWRLDDDRIAPNATYNLTGQLPPGRILDIVPDDHGVVWLVRSSGLATLRVSDGQLRHLSSNDGLPAIEFQAGTGTRLPDGRIAAGGRGGVVVIHPDRLRSVEAAPGVHLTRLQAGDRLVALGSSEIENVTLGHDNNNLYLDFLANSFVAPDRNRFRLMLEGWDDDWLEVIGQTRHYYSNLAPGRYRFRVQAAPPGGPWNESGDEVLITIERPPWLSGWAIAAYFVVGVTGAGAGVQGYRRSVRRRREFREARQKRQLAEEQRKVIERLNQSLEPLDLAATLAGEVLRVVGGQQACLGFVDERLPREIVCTDETDSPPSRQDWRRALETADGKRRLAVSLSVAQRDIARVVVEAGAAGFHPDHAERLPLFEEMAGQALHNAMLLQRVRMLAERAEQASSAKSEFLATMSHEIRTPLHGVLGMVDLLYQTETEPGQQDILDTLRQSGLQLQRIIDDVLDISRIEAGRLNLNAQPFDLMATLEQVVDLHAPNAAQKGLDLRLRIASALPLTAVGDSDRMTQVLGNLLSNAVKFTCEGGVELVAEVGADNQLVLIVADSGPGIGPQDRERLFEPFTQLDASITRTHSGSGLGLAICRRLVHAMDGTLELMSACHAGSRFRVRLPVFDEVFEPPVGGMTSLLDDLVICACVEPPVLRVLRRLARRWSLTVVDARTEPRSCGLLLVDPHALDESEVGRLDEWRNRAEALAWLQSPFASRKTTMPHLPDEAHFLRWPLVESRLIGLLLDLRLARSVVQGVN